MENIRVEVRERFELDKKMREEIISERIKKRRVQINFMISTYIWHQLQYSNSFPPISCLVCY